VTINFSNNILHHEISKQLHT